MGTKALNSLRGRLLEYDGKATSSLSETEAALSGEDGYLEGLIELIADPSGHIANGATWLLKSGLERGEDLAAEQVEQLVDRLPQSGDWAAALHICQSIRLMTVPIGAAEPLAIWLCQLLDHDRPFVRAWALDGLGAVSKAHEPFAARFNAALAEALEDPAASVRARARKLAG